MFKIFSNDNGDYYKRIEEFSQTNSNTDEFDVTKGGFCYGLALQWLSYSLSIDQSRLSFIDPKKLFPKKNAYFDIHSKGYINAVEVQRRQKDYVICINQLGDLKEKFSLFAGKNMSVPSVEENSSILAGYWAKLNIQARMGLLGGVFGDDDLPETISIKIQGYEEEILKNKKLNSLKEINDQQGILELVYKGKKYAEDAGKVLKKEFHKKTSALVKLNFHPLQYGGIDGGIQSSYSPGRSGPSEESFLKNYDEWKDAGWIISLSPRIYGYATPEEQAQDYEAISHAIAFWNHSKRIYWFDPNFGVFERKREGGFWRFIEGQEAYRNKYRSFIIRSYGKMHPETDLELFLKDLP